MLNIKKEPEDEVKAKKKSQVPASDLLHTLCSEIAGEKPSTRAPPCGYLNHKTIGPKLGVHGQNAGQWYVRCINCKETWVYRRELSERERKAVEKQEQDDVQGHPIREKLIKDIIKELKPTIVNGVRKAKPGSKVSFTLTGHFEQVDAQGSTRRTTLEKGNTSLLLENWREQSQTDLSINSTDTRTPPKWRGKRQLSPSPVRNCSPLGSNWKKNSPKRQRKLEQSPTISESAHASSSRNRRESKQEVDIGISQRSSSPIDLTLGMESSSEDDSVVVLP